VSINLAFSRKDSEEYGREEVRLKILGVEVPGNLSVRLFRALEVMEKSLVSMISGMRSCVVSGQDQYGCCFDKLQGFTKFL
jgi:hypothetical protein